MFFAPALRRAAALQRGARSRLPAASCGAVRSITRFADPWFEQYAQPTSGFVDSTGFMNRLPLRLEGTHAILHGTANAEQMWKEYEDEPFTPVLVGGKAVVNIWFNNFTDTDCGGEYFEAWYNTYVTPKSGARLDLPLETPFSLIMADPSALVYLQRVICGNTPGNPGAAEKAICGGRGIWGFPKHPVPAQLHFGYTEDGKAVKFSGHHLDKEAVKLDMRLPEADDGAVTIPVEAASGPDQCIGGPMLGGTHQNQNGSHQVRYGQAFKCTQHFKPWDAQTDSLTFGSDDHFAAPIKRWGFEPVLKAHTSDMRIVAFKPANWVSAEEAAAKGAEYEKQLASGVKGGVLVS